jgi:hypothetical protein
MILIVNNYITRYRDWILISQQINRIVGRCRGRLGIEREITTNPAIISQDNCVISIVAVDSQIFIRADSKTEIVPTCTTIQHDGTRRPTVNRHIVVFVNRTEQHLHIIVACTSVDRKVL